MEYQFELVGKIGSMALIRKEDREIDYNIFSRLGSELKPGMIWVTSGATEIGRLDYIKRTGCELCGDPEQDKADYASQGQAVLEHTHFNDPEKCEHIRQLMIRAARQKTIPIVNYNDPVSDEENRKMELAARRRNGEEVHECVDNDETASLIARLVRARLLVLLTSTEGIYQVSNDPSTLVREVTGRSFEEVEQKIRTLQDSCVGASRAGANGARAKLEYAMECVRGGTTVIIGNAQHRLSDLVAGRVPCTRIGVDA